MQERLPGQVDFSNAKKALEYYDGRIGRLNQDLDAAATNKRVLDVIEQIKRLEDTVRVAFFEDTKTYNHRSACMVTGLGFIREMVTKYNP